MRNQTLRTTMMISILTLISALTAHAQAGSSFVVKVPFDFTLSGKTLPAGQYTVSRSTQGSSEGLMIRNQKQGAYVQTKLVQTTDRQEETQVLFRRYGNQYFLFQIWISGRTTGREVFKSTREQKLSRALDQSSKKPETVAIMGQPR